MKEPVLTGTHLSYREVDVIVQKAANKVKRAYRSTGSLVYDDLVQTGWEGVQAALNGGRALAHKNPPAYLYSAAYGYMTHALHRKSRMVHYPWAILKNNQEGLGHLSLEALNTEKPMKPTPLVKSAPLGLIDLLQSFSKRDQNAILAGHPPMSRKGKALYDKIKSEYSEWYNASA